MRKAGGATWAILFAILLVAVPPSWAGPDSGKSKDIEKLLRVSGIYEQMVYMKSNLLNSYSQALSLSFPKIPDAFWDEFNNLIGQKEMDELMARVIPVYEKHMDHEAVKELIKMFETPFWEEWKTKMPTISREAGLAGSLWAQEISQSGAFNEKIDSLVEKYELEKLNPKKEK